MENPFSKLSGNTSLTSIKDGLFGMLSSWINVKAFLWLLLGFILVSWLAYHNFSKFQSEAVAHGQTKGKLSSAETRLSNIVTNYEKALAQDAKEAKELRTLLQAKDEELKRPHEAETIRITEKATSIKNRSCSKENEDLLREYITKRQGEVR